MLASAGHRVRQFLGALRPRVDAPSRRHAYRYLSPPEQTLFETMMLRDQQHGIIVFLRVRAAAGDEDRSLFAAALLHDCGKGRVALWQRVAHVLLGAVAPAIRRRIAREGGGWRASFFRLLYHPEIGARMAAEAGAHADVVRMIREQDAPAAEGPLALLQAADEA